MRANPRQRQWLATVDVRELNSVRWGPLRQMFPAFVEEIELGRYLKRLLRTHGCEAVQIEACPDSGGGRSRHVYDVFLLVDQPGDR